MLLLTYSPSAWWDPSYHVNHRKDPADKVMQNYAAMVCDVKLKQGALFIDGVAEK